MIEVFELWILILREGGGGEGRVRVNSSLPELLGQKKMCRNRIFSPKHIPRTFDVFDSFITIVELYFYIFFFSSFLRSLFFERIERTRKNKWNDFGFEIFGYVVVC